MTEAAEAVREAGNPWARPFHRQTPTQRYRAGQAHVGKERIVTVSRDRSTNPADQTDWCGWVISVAAAWPTGSDVLVLRDDHRHDMAISLATIIAIRNPHTGADVYLHAGDTAPVAGQ